MWTVLYLLSDAYAVISIGSYIQSKYCHSFIKFRSTEEENLSDIVTYLFLKSPKQSSFKKSHHFYTIVTIRMFAFKSKREKY